MTPPLQLTASPSVKVYQKGSNRFNIKVIRKEGFTGAVTVSAPRRPAGVSQELARG